MTDFQVDTATGIWHCERDAHSFDEPLASALVEFLKAEKANVVLDVGCGSGDYVEHLRNAGLDATGYDGNPKTSEFNKHCYVSDILSGIAYNADWILCLEVAEHIPPQHEHNFLCAITDCVKRGVILSWFPEEGHGIGHFNPRSNEYVRERMKELGFRPDDDAQTRLRAVVTLWWFTKSLQIFRRIGTV